MTENEQYEAEAEQVRQIMARNGETARTLLEDM